MHILKKSLVVGLSLVVFTFVLPFQVMQTVLRKLVGNGRFDIKLISEVYAETFYTVQDALKVLLPQAQNIKEEVKALGEEQKKSIAQAAEVTFDPNLDKEYHIYSGETNGQVTGYAIEDTVKGKWGPIHYMVALESDGKIKDIVVLELKERRGRPVKERRFLDQFLGKAKQDQIKLNKDIKGVSGATISSRGMSNGVRKIVYVFNELYKK